MSSRMADDQIPFGRPMLDSAEIEAVAKVLSGPTLVHGPRAREFEEQFANRIGCTNAVTVSSCTAGLHLSLLANDIGPGDRVMVPSMTHVATAHAVEFCGAQPVFVDVEPDSGNIDPDAVEAETAEDLRAIIVVHYLGLPCDMDRILAFVEKVDAAVIEDCALAVDAKYGERKAGTLADAGCFSFYPIKHMTTLEGGMVTTNDPTLAERITRCKAFGYDRTVANRIKPGIYDVIELGYNYRMNEAQASVGLIQLGKLDRFQATRAENYNRLRHLLSDISEVIVFAPSKGRAVSSHYCLNAVLPRDGRIDRDSIVAELKSAGIGTSVHYPRPVPLMTYYKDKYGFRQGQFPIAEWLADQTISLPVGPHLRAGDTDRIAAALKTAIHNVRH